MLTFHGADTNQFKKIMLETQYSAQAQASNLQAMLATFQRGTPREGRGKRHNQVITGLFSYWFSNTAMYCGGIPR